MQRADWRGVFPAITTPFRDDFAVDHEALAAHVRWLVEHGVDGIIALGSLGEGATLTRTEKRAILETCREATEGRVPLVAGIGATSAAEARQLVGAAAVARCDGLMVLPPYLYQGDARETEGWFREIIGSSALPCMLYNNPIAYGTDVTPEVLETLADLEGLHAVKESSGDVRRITAIRERLGERLAIFVGLDDAVVEGVAAGAFGWVAGLVNALPDDSVRLFALAEAGDYAAATALYHRLLPLLRLDTVPKFVQLIKLVQEVVGRGSARVRPPRMALTAVEREAVVALVRAHCGRAVGASA